MSFNKFAILKLRINEIKKTVSFILKCPSLVEDVGGKSTIFIFLYIFLLFLSVDSYHIP